MKNGMVTAMGSTKKALAAFDPGLPEDDLRRLYRTLVLGRVMDDRLLRLQRQGRLGFYMTATGEEATILGAAYALRDSDWIFPAYRETLAAMWRGLSMRRLLCQLMGNADDPLQGRQMPIHLSERSLGFVSVSSPVGTQIPQAVGAAHGARLRGDDIVSLAFFGEGTSSEGDFHVGLNFAGVMKAPTIFVLRNNGWAISVPLSKQTACENLAERAVAYGIHGVRVDGSDLFAMIQVTREAAERARSGEGPTLIEAVTQRVGAHSSSDDPSAYRDEDAMSAWMKKNDPVERVRKYLEVQSLWTAEWQAEIEEAITAEIVDAIRYAESIGPPTIDSMVEDVYAHLPPHLAEERDALKKALGPDHRPGAHH